MPCLFGVPGDLLFSEGEWKGHVDLGERGGVGGELAGGEGGETAVGGDVMYERRGKEKEKHSTVELCMAHPLCPHLSQHSTKLFYTLRLCAQTACAHSQPLRLVHLATTGVGHNCLEGRGNLTV